MSYYTRYTLDYFGENVSAKSVIEALAEINPYYFNTNSYLDEAFEEPMNWDSCESDMLKLSERFPKVLFSLAGEGEDREDNWIDYFKAGKMQTCYGRIVYEPFDADFFNMEEDING